MKNLTSIEVEKATERGREIMGANSGTSEGVRKAWETRHAGFPSTDIHGNKFGGLRKSQATALAKAHDLRMFSPRTKSAEQAKAHLASRAAYYGSENAFHGTGTEQEAELHQTAADLHRVAGRQQRALGNWRSAGQHEDNSAGHQTVASNLAWLKAGKPDLHFDSSD